MYPRHKYHPEKESVIVKTEAQDKELGPGWYNSPAEFGVETCPSRFSPDAKILANKEAFEKQSKKFARSKS